MFHMVQLEDGCYRVSVDFSIKSTHVHYEWTFRETESEAEESGKFCINLKFEAED